MFAAQARLDPVAVGAKKLRVVFFAAQDRAIEVEVLPIGDSVSAAMHRLDVIDLKAERFVETAPFAAPTQAVDDEIAELPAVPSILVLARRVLLEIRSDVCPEQAHDAVCELLLFDPLGLRFGLPCAVFAVVFVLAVAVGSAPRALGFRSLKGISVAPNCDLKKSGP